VGLIDRPFGDGNHVYVLKTRFAIKENDKNVIDEEDVSVANYLNSFSKRDVFI
jgi:hypothetical protein